MDHKAIVAELGGIRPLARQLGHPSHTTVQGWFDRNRIPIERWSEIIGAAKALGKDLTTDDLMPKELRGAA